MAGRHASKLDPQLMSGRTQAVYYRDKAGKEPVTRFLGGTDPAAAAKIDESGEYLNGGPELAPPSLRSARR